MKDGKYDGNFANNQRHGFGALSWSNGHYYEGQWQNDQLSGKGFFKSKDGIVY